MHRRPGGWSRMGFRGRWRRRCSRAPAQNRAKRVLTAFIRRSSRIPKQACCSCHGRGLVVTPARGISTVFAVDIKIPPGPGLCYCSLTLGVSRDDTATIRSASPGGEVTELVRSFCCGGKRRGQRCRRRRIVLPRMPTITINRFPPPSAPCFVLAPILEAPILAVTNSTLAGPGYRVFAAEVLVHVAQL